MGSQPQSARRQRFLGKARDTLRARWRTGTLKHQEGVSMKFELVADIRAQAGKGIARQLRKRGAIPGVLYGQGECLLLALDQIPLVKILRSQAGTSALISLTLHGNSDNATRNALLRDWQVDPVTGDLLHVDLFEVSMSKEIRVRIPIKLIGGTPMGVKEGGVIHHNLRDLHVACLPGAMPDAIEIDVSHLNIGQGIHINALHPGEGIRLLDEGDQMVVSVAAPMSDAKLEALLTSGVAVEEGKEPEVLGKVKEVAPEAVPGAEPKAEKKEVPEEKKK